MGVDVGIPDLDSYKLSIYTSFTGLLLMEVVREVYGNDDEL